MVEGMIHKTSTGDQMFPMAKKLPRGIPSILSMRITKRALEPSMLAIAFHSGPTCSFKPTDYGAFLNRNGEPVVFNEHCRPPGYVSVPSGNHYVTRHCRKLTKESGRSVYAVFRNKTRKRPAGQIALHIPDDVFKQLRSDWKTIRKGRSESLWHKLHQEFPRMPLADRNELHELLMSNYANPVTKSARSRSLTTLYMYIRDRYTHANPLKTHQTQSEGAFREVGETVDKILSSWRGEN